MTLPGPDARRSELVDILVDPRSTYTWVSKAVLGGLAVEGKMLGKFRTADGTLLERRLGEAVVEHVGERARTMLVFAEEGNAQVLGVHAPEGLGPEVDPMARRLRKAEAVLALCLF